MQVHSAPKSIDGMNEDISSQEEITYNDKNLVPLAITVEDIAAIRIQNAFRAYKVILALVVPSCCYGFGFAFVSLCISACFLKD